MLHALGMVDRRDLAGALSRASDWVRDEFAYIEDIAAGLGCERRIEGGPGVVFRLGQRKVGHVHPKRGHLGVGLPETMRPDVQALTGALRAQRGAAWFNYSPDVADRETVELLLTVSAEGVSFEPVEAHVADVLGGEHSPATQTRIRSTASDDEDLRLVLAVLRAFERHEAVTGVPSPVKPLRETLFFRWEGPRLPTGGKYSPLIPHSPGARDSRVRQGTKDLVHEHVTPVSGVIRGLLRDLPSDEEALRRVLEEVSDRVIITRTEDRALTAAGYRDSAPDPLDPWSRYTALGLSRADFAPFSR
ncbi:hypothetical protein ACI78R_16200 [Geodermatophilus sp. SYSU D01106]